jgi:hypothetical protein
MKAWEGRIAALGEGRRRECTADEAFAVARASTPQQGVVETGDAQADLRPGMRVEVAPDDTRRGAVLGQIHALSWNEVAVRRADPRCGEVVVHFPRLGYRLRRVD